MSESQMNVHEKALRRDSDDPRVDLSARFAEARIVAGGESKPLTQDAPLSWGAGEHVANESGPGDKPLSPELANTAGVGVGTVAHHGNRLRASGARSGVAAIINHTEGRE